MNIPNVMNLVSYSQELFASSRAISSVMEQSALIEEFGWQVLLRIGRLAVAHPYEENALQRNAGIASGLHVPRNRGVWAFGERSHALATLGECPAVIWARHRTCVMAPTGGETSAPMRTDVCKDSGSRFAPKHAKLVAQQLHVRCGRRRLRRVRLTSGYQ